jgi:hypothetical protein
LKLIEQQGDGASISYNSLGEDSETDSCVKKFTLSSSSIPTDSIDADSPLIPSYQGHYGLYGMKGCYYLDDYGIGGWLINNDIKTWKTPKKKRDINLIYSFWTKPFKPTPGNHRPTGGFAKEAHHWMCWALSVIQAAKFYNNVHLYTDNLGKKILSDILQLPFTMVDTCLEDIEDVNENYWAYGKIVAYSKQKEPFINIDGDVLLWQPLPQELETAEIACQDLEDSSLVPLHYIPPIKLAEEHLIHLPSAWIRDKAHRSSRIPVHVGIVGGTDIALFQEYRKQVDEFLFHPFNREGWDALYKQGQGAMLSWFNTIFEQYLLGAICRSRKVKPTCLIPRRKRADIFFISDLGYSHLMGGTAKKNSDILQGMEKRLATDHIALLNRIEDLVKI